jgi:hypothetical protein
MAKDRVGSIWDFSISDTGVLLDTDTPKSPENTFPSQWKYRVTGGSSNPIRVRSAMISSGVALSPRITAAGSPGIRYTMLNTTTDTINNTGMMDSTRRITYFFIAPSLPAIGKGGEPPSPFPITYSRTWTFQK